MRIKTLCSIAAVVAALAAPMVANASRPALDALRLAVPSTAMTETDVYAVFMTQFGIDTAQIDTARIRAVQAELGERSTGTLASGETVQRLRAIAAAIAQANADHAAATARATAALPPLGARSGPPGGLSPPDADDASDADEESADGDAVPMLIAYVRAYAAVHCNPGTQVVPLSPHTFTCTDPQFRIVEGACDLDPSGEMNCHSKVVPPAGREEPLPPLRQPPRMAATNVESNFCSSTACKVAVVGGAVVLGGTTVYLAIPAFSDRLSVPF